jgi:hypothetical protein
MFALINGLLLQHPPHHTMAAQETTKCKRLPIQKSWSFAPTAHQLKDQKNQLKANKVLFNLQMLQRQTW